MSGKLERKRYTKDSSYQILYNVRSKLLNEEAYQI